MQRGGRGRNACGIGIGMPGFEGVESIGGARGLRPPACQDAWRSRPAARNRGRHRPRALPRGDDGKGDAALEQFGVERTSDQARRIDGGYRGAEDVVKIGSQPLDGAAQWSFLGSDQAERPVTALNVRSKRPITCSASSFAQS